MRIIATIPHPSVRISIFHMNDKYIVKLEAGPLEQAFKFSAEEVKGPEHIEKIMDSVFMQQILERFNDMFTSLQAAKSRNS